MTSAKTFPRPSFFSSIWIFRWSLDDDLSDTRTYLYNADEERLLFGRHIIKRGNLSLSTIKLGTVGTVINCSEDHKAWPYSNPLLQWRKKKLEVEK